MALSAREDSSAGKRTIWTSVEGGAGAILADQGPCEAAIEISAEVAVAEQIR